MSKTLDLQDEEIELLLSSYQNKLKDVHLELEQLKLKEANIQNRIKELSNITGAKILDTINAAAVVKELTGSLSANGIKVLSNIQREAQTFVEHYTFSQKVQSVFDSLVGEISTSQVYEYLIAQYPQEGMKDKLRVIENISKELGKAKDNKIYYIGKRLDSNGKKTYGLLEWIKK